MNLEQGKDTGDSSFLDDVKSKAFGAQMSGSLEETINRRSHFRQGKADALS